MSTEGESGEQTSNDKKEGENESKEGEEKDGKDGKEKKEDAAPPPHGDKTPWQVFMETLQTEFKASKDWNDSTKALSSGYQEFTQNPAVQKAKTAYEEAAKGATKGTSEALKSTGRVIGKSAAAVWDSPVGKVTRKVASVAGEGLDKATKPVRETEAYKSVKNVIDDGSSSRYGGWLEKEERKRRRAIREAQMGRTGGKMEKMDEDPEAGTNVTLHKDAAWKESWRDFKQSSKLFQQIDSMKSVYEQSDNPLISTARSWADTIGGFFAENETAMVIKKLREMDPTFQLEPFLIEMREYILPEVLDAYVKGDTETLKTWLSAAQYNVYAALMQQYTTAGLKSDGRILDIRHVEVANARLLDPGDVPVFVITCRTQEVHVYRNKKSGDLAAGMEDKVQQVTYAIGVTRIAEDVMNPETHGWRLIELQKSARDYY
ncbi:TIM44 subunit of mitochondria import inner membrane translocase [Microthyrium microscopicum]|uniref:Mitochondrial import inner membrane translocase subunit TIM44 n=1 Tax=Microthyrium microscopicum TaxID=703497 RepID=A0A6A6U9Q2_9PEZI|nr:TIM44 subunit of mitochondria import inner membrane translocase [Microthyrium microscopicum]